MDDLYNVRDYERAAFGSHWTGPKIGARFAHGKLTRVAIYRKDRGGDGQTVTVFCDATPARFYVLKVHAGKNSVGKKKQAYKVGTGSSQHELAAKMAQAIAIGMLGAPIFDTNNTTRTKGKK